MVVIDESTIAFQQYELGVSAHNRGANFRSLSAGIINVPEVGTRTESERLPEPIRKDMSHEQWLGLVKPVSTFALMARRTKAAMVRA